MTAALNARGVVLCPDPICHSTLTQPAQAVAALDDIAGWDDFRLCHDSFQHFRDRDARIFPDRVGLIHISGIARPDLSPANLTETDRGFVCAGDRVDNVTRLRAIVQSKTGKPLVILRVSLIRVNPIKRDSLYQGFVSIEPISPATQTDPQIASRLRDSIAHVTGALQ